MDYEQIRIAVLENKLGTSLPERAQLAARGSPKGEARAIIGRQIAPTILRGGQAVV
jgi:hypothetical protein